MECSKGLSDSWTSQKTGLKLFHGEFAEVRCAVEEICDEGDLGKIFLGQLIAHIVRKGHRVVSDRRRIVSWLECQGSYGKTS